MFLSFLTGCCRREPHHPPWYSGTTRGCRGRATWWCKDWTCPATCLWRLTLSSLLMCAHHLHPPQPGPVHQYPRAGSTAGQAQVKRKVSSAVAPAAVNSCPQRELFPAPPSGPQLFMLGPVTSHGPVLGAAPQALGASLSSAAPAPVRKRTCSVLRNTCKKCGQFRTAETGHSQYKGIIYCPSVEAVPKEQWLEDIKKCMKNKLINCPPLPEAWTLA